MNVCPSTITSAKSFIKKHHRHSRVPQGALFAVAIEDGGVVCGVATIGRPVARALQDGYSAEVTRCCTNGIKNGCSMLYGAARRAAKALGYRRLYTYTLATESGSSLRAAGFREDAKVKGREWSCPSRPRKKGAPAQTIDKIRWVWL